MATKRGVRTKEGEDLSPNNIERVIKALENKCTKKEACAMLKISYNTTRLGKIIQEYKDNLIFVANRKKALRGKPITDAEKSNIVKQYLEQTSLSEISENTFRSTNVIKNVLKQYNIPLRTVSHSYFEPTFIDADPMEDYKEDDLVYSARYNAPAYICGEFDSKHSLEGTIYKIWILGDHCRYALQPAYELADLRKAQKELGIKVEGMSGDEMKLLIYEALKKAKKDKK